MQKKLNVILMKYTSLPESTIFSSAKICYSNSDVEHIVEVGDPDYKNLLNEVIDSGHLSTIEHVSFTFAIEGISRVCSHQLVRHRLASFSQQSQRYVDEKDFDYIIPKTIEENEELKNSFEIYMKQIQNIYNEFVEGIKKSGYSTQIAREDARFVLPNATETKIIVTMNARELLHFFKLRLCNRAQWEIRELALQMLKMVKPLAPIIFKNAGPSCYNGKCSEGTKSCGKSKEIEEMIAWI